MILVDKTIRHYCTDWAALGSLWNPLRGPLLNPFVERGVQNGKSYGLSICGYDVRVDLGENIERIYLEPGQFLLVATCERFCMPIDIVGFVHDKSTWAREGLAVQNTVIEPGWEGYLTLELTNHGNKELLIDSGDPIAQIIFHRTEGMPERGYSGKYQNQEAGPQKARYE